MKRQFSSMSGALIGVQSLGNADLQAIEIQREGQDLRETSALVRRAPGGELLVEVDGVVRTVHASLIGEQVWLTSPGIADAGGTTVRLRRHEVQRAGRGAAGGGALNSVAAPMTGRIVVVHVQAGDEVAHEQPLVVVEAMKMEHQLRAPRAGVVARVPCAVGDLVDGGVVLVELEAPPADAD